MTLFPLWSFYFSVVKPFNVVEPAKLMIIIADRQTELGKWVQSQTGRRYREGSANYLGLEKEGKIIAVAQYEDNNGVSVRADLIIAANHLSNAFIQYAFYYPFMQMGVSKVIAYLYGDNREVELFMKGLGFLEESRIKNACPKGDICIFTMTVAQCRFLIKH